MRKNILLIEDDPTLAETLSVNLIAEGFHVFWARDGIEGLARAFQEKPDMILLDILLPKQDGLTVLAELRKDMWGKHVPVIILSNVHRPIDVAIAVSGNVYEYLVKADWKIEDIILRVREHLVGTR